MTFSDASRPLLPIGIEVVALKDQEINTTGPRDQLQRVGERLDYSEGGVISRLKR